MLGVLGYAVWRLAPVALEAVKPGLSAIEWAAFAASIVILGYSEGYKGFQKAFSPRVVARALSLKRRPRPLRVLLAPAFCAGHFGATKARKNAAWVLTLGIVGLVLLVARLIIIIIILV